MRGKIIIKAGTGWFFNKDERGYLTLKEDNLCGLVEEISIISDDADVASIFSGSKGAALWKLNLPEQERTIAEKKELLKVGQPHLTQLCKERFAEYGKTCAECLVLPEDFTDEIRRREVINRQNDYFEKGIIAIYNGKNLADNDYLAMDLATCIDADLVIMLSNPTDGLGTGGGGSKQKAKEILAEKGIELKILNGEYEHSNGAFDSKYAPKIRKVLEKYAI